MSLKQIAKIFVVAVLPMAACAVLGGKLIAFLFASDVFRAIAAFIYAIPMTWLFFKYIDWIHERKIV